MNIHPHSPSLPEKTYPPHLHPFETVIVDVTHRCNMACANCYIPERHPPDMDIDQLMSCIRQFPRRTNIRVAGAEPTLRKDLPEIISRIRSFGHRVALMTNGLRLAQRSYVERLREAGLRHVYLSMNGAGNDAWYLAIDNLACANKKLQALENILAARIIVNTGTILKRGVNEAAVAEMIGLLKRHAPRTAVVKFRNVGALGRYDARAERQNLSMAEMLALVAREIGTDAETLERYRAVKGYDEENSRLFPLDLTSAAGRGLWCKVTNWQADALGRVDPGSRRRGRVTPDFKLAGFFETM
ncbi:MAG: radical SAM protein [Pseudomonadota bacterium]